MYSKGRKLLIVEMLQHRSSASVNKYDYLDTFISTIKRFTHFTHHPVFRICFLGWLTIEEEWN